jgi:hypothetical protein
VGGYDLDFTIYNLLKEGLSCKDIQYKLSINKQLLSYYLKKLKTKGYIKRVAYGVWNIIKPYEQTSTNISTGVATSTNYPTQHFFKEIRGHGFVFKLAIPKLINWEKREEYLIKKGIEYKPLIFLHKKGQRINIYNNKVWLTASSIIIYFKKSKSFYDTSAEGSYNNVILELIRIIEKIETTLSVSLKINKLYKFKVSRQHYAKVKDDLAKYYLKHNKKLEVYNNKGLWLLIDNSFNLQELEAVSQDTAVTDMDKVVIPFFNDLKDWHDKSGEVIKISEMAKLQMTFAKNINTHIGAIQELGNQVSLLSNIIVDLKKNINTNNLKKEQ